MDLTYHYSRFLTAPFFLSCACAKIPATTATRPLPAYAPGNQAQEMTY
jgi:hypothetical protein